MIDINRVVTDRIFNILHHTGQTLTRAQQYLRWATVATIDMGQKEGDCCE